MLRQLRKPLRLERLESREVPTVNLNLATASLFNSYKDVGFRNTHVAGLTASVNGQIDLNVNNYRAEIRWNPSGAWEPGTILLNGGGGSVRFHIKGTHTYRDLGLHPIDVKVTGPDGTTATKRTTSSSVSQLPNFFPGVEPPVAAAALPPSNVFLNLSTAGTISSFAGVGFRLNNVGGVTGLLNNQRDLDLNHYRVSINWGDSSAWVEGVVAPNNGGGSVPFLLKGSHTYARAGQYRVVVYVTGADGTTLSENTVTAVVAQPPSGRPGVEPPVAPALLSPTNVFLNLTTASLISAPTGTTIGVRVGGFNPSVNNQTDRDASNYRVQINWGDSSKWFEGVVAPNQAGGSTVFFANGTHKYLVPGTYPVLIHVTAPDGTTKTERTTSVTVTGPRVFQIDKAAFLAAYQSPSGFGNSFRTPGRLDEAALAGLSRLIDNINADPFLTRDSRFMAYLLATARRETFAGGFETWRPDAGGFVSVVSPANLARATRALRANADLFGRPEWRTLDLVANPSQLQEPSVAYFVASAGLREGWFGRFPVRNARGQIVRFGNFKLADFFNARRTDWVGARRVVNGLDRAALFGAEAQRMFGLLQRTFLVG